MRLSQAEREVLRATAASVFGHDAVLRLFGSRVDDARRGGDIDLLVETHMSDPAAIAAAHTRFLAAVYARLGEQKIDVLIDFPGRTHQSPIWDIAREQGVVL